jgi:hypothetical protein
LKSGQSSLGCQNGNSGIGLSTFKISPLFYFNVEKHYIVLQKEQKRNTLTKQNFFKIWHPLLMVLR